MKFHDRCLMYTIHANTLSAGRPRNGSGLGGTILVLLLTLAASGVLLWADRAFV